MSRKQAPTAYSITAEDLAQVVSEHAAEWGVTAYYAVTLGKPTGPAAYVDVTLREGLYVPGGKELQRIRYPLDARHVERWPANLMHALMHAYDRLRAEPWTWPEHKRKEARGE